jgi:hypothetical protein
MQPPDDLTAAHRYCSRSDHPPVHLLRHVVVVALEAAGRDAYRGGERV